MRQTEPAPASVPPAAGKRFDGLRVISFPCAWRTASVGRRRPLEDGCARFAMTSGMRRGVLGAALRIEGVAADRTFRRSER
jgi:hypothetical protein